MNNSFILSQEVVGMCPPPIEVTYNLTHNKEQFTATVGKMLYFVQLDFLMVDDNDTLHFFSKIDNLFVLSQKLSCLIKTGLYCIVKITLQALGMKRIMERLPF